MKRAFILLGILLAIPILGLLTTAGILAKVETDLSEGGKPISVSAVCSNYELRANADVGPFCAEIDRINQIAEASIGVGLVAAALPLFYWLASILLGTSRFGLAWFFPLILRLSLLLLAAIVVVQGLILVASVYTVEAYLVGRVHGVLLLVIGLGAVVVSLRLVWAALTLGRAKETFVEGVIATKSGHPKLHQVVNVIAKKLGSRAPDNIVLGLEPTFFATSAKIRLPERSTPLRGETLFISLPLSRLFSIEEFVAVVAHELGHFRGKDTAYSLKFAPVYAGLSDTINKTGASKDPSALDVMALPAIALLGFMLDVFSRNESSISRKREFAADRAATEVAPPAALAGALIKTAAYAPVWQVMLDISCERVRRNEFFDNLSSAFSESCRYDVDETRLLSSIESYLATKIVHPTDSHPPIAERIKSLGLECSRQDCLTLLRPAVMSASASRSFDN